MQIVYWEIQYLSSPPVIKHCKKCGKKTEYVCSKLFRVNAQRKYLDIWLIYKCSECNSTWNMTIYSRINPKSIAPKILEGFQSNDEELVGKYAMDTELIRKNGAEVGYPEYEILGPCIDFNIPVELHIKSNPFRLKVSALLRKKMNLSSFAFEHLITSGLIRSISVLDLKKCRAQREVIVAIGK